MKDNINLSKNYLFTSESVSEGHPDKVCDQVADAVLDAALSMDPKSRVACECFATTGMIVVGGEITTQACINFPDVVRGVIKDIGYTKNDLKFDAESVAVINVINKQSHDIAMGVDTNGAGDQGMMFGYAVNETENYMPASVAYAHKLVKKLADIRKTTDFMPYLRPDAKSQVTIEYTPEHKVKRIDTIVISTQHDPEVEQIQIKNDCLKYIINDVFKNTRLVDDNTKIYINPIGRFVIGGPHGDTGLTGRKIIVDSYGGKAPHGGGAFSGKDATKVDRSAAYMARYIAKNVVAAGLSNECIIQLSYAIGKPDPVSIYIKMDNEELEYELREYIIKNIKLDPKGIIDKLDLCKPIFRKTSNYGHFGRPEFTWEKLDLVDDLKKLK